jgi:hypothetical protein
MRKFFQWDNYSAIDNQLYKQNEQQNKPERA